MDLFRGTIRGNRLAACPQMSRCFSRSLGADGLPPCSQDLQLTIYDYDAVAARLDLIGSVIHQIRKKSYFMTAGLAINQRYK